jgi:septal ring factor EnvC (AmiA/AmiB activator)
MAAETFILGHDLDRESGAQRRNEFLDRCGLFTWRPVQPARQSDNHSAEAVVFGGEPLHFSLHLVQCVTGRHRQRHQWTREKSGRVADREPHSPATYVYTQYSHPDAIFCRTAMSFRRLALKTAMLVVSVTALTAAEFQGDGRQQTETLSRRATERLQSLNDEADRLAAEERTLLGDLRRLELEREIRTAEMQRARDDARSAAMELAMLDEEVATLTEQSRAALPDIRARLVTLYKLGRGQYARLLLSASDLRQFGQAVRLVSALAEQDRRRLGEHQQRLTELDRARSAARERQERLKQAEIDTEKARTAVEQALAAHAATVRDIDTRRDLNAQFSSELQSAQQRLQSSLSGLSSPSSLPIAPFKGDLVWPVEGDIHQRFGSSAAGRPPLRGIEIASAENVPVRAVHDGSVVYADAFTGYGRLVIVDHGSQTFTLYGNLGEILVSKGTHVDRGSVVGRAGLPEGDRALLYFELRVDGRAVDPLQWLTKR